MNRCIAPLAVFVSFIASTPIQAFADGPENLVDTPKDAASVAALKFLASSELPQDGKDGLCAAVKSDAERTHWSGRHGTKLFGVVARRVPHSPARQRVALATMRAVDSLAFAEILKLKVVLDNFESQGFTNGPALQEAVAKAAGSTDFAGKLGDVVHQADVVGDYAVAYAIAEESTVVARLREVDASNEIKGAYRDVVHGQLRAAMMAEKWADALTLSSHLQSLRLSSAAIQLDGIKCLAALDRSTECIPLATEWLAEFSETADVTLIEAIGDEMLKIESAEAQRIATLAFRLVARRLTTSPRAGSKAK